MMALAITEVAPQVRGKPISPRGRARLRSRRHRRRIRLALVKNNGGQLRKEGQRPVALVAPIEADADDPQPSGLQYRNCSKFWEMSRLAEEMIEYKLVRAQLRAERKAVARESARQMHGNELSLRIQARRALALLRQPAFLSMRIDELEEDEDVHDHLLAVQLEEIDVVVYQRLAAA